jgi:hypothetical protein
MQKTFKYEDIEQILAEADELLDRVSIIISATPHRPTVRREMWIELGLLRGRRVGPAM